MCVEEECFSCFIRFDACVILRIKKAGCFFTVFVGVVIFQRGGYFYGIALAVVVEDDVCKEYVQDIERGQ